MFFECTTHTMSMSEATILSNAHHQQESELRLSKVTQRVKNPPAMQETWVLSLAQEDFLEKEMATHTGILAWRIP